MAHGLLRAALLLLGCLRPPRAHGATGHRRAWHMPRFVPRPVARRRLLVLINDRTGLFEQPATQPESEPGRFQVALVVYLC